MTMMQHPVGLRPIAAGRRSLRWLAGATTNAQDPTDVADSIELIIYFPVPSKDASGIWVSARKGIGHSMSYREEPLDL